MRKPLAAMLAITALFGAGASAAELPRTSMFLELVRERHIPPVSKESWARHIGDDCVWVGRGLRVVGRAEVQGLQIDTGKRVDIEDFAAHDYGDVAVLTYLVIERQPVEGREVITRLRKMDTYASREGRWQLIANAEVVGKPDRVAVTLDAATLDRHTGTYESVFNGKAIHTRIWRDGTRLLAQTEGQEPGELRPLSPTVFFDATEPQEGGPENVFVAGPDGRTVEWIYRDGAVEVRSKRVTERKL